MGGGMLEGGHQYNGSQKESLVTTHQPTYRSYLLRLWQTTNKTAFRASLLNVHDPTDQHHFVTIDDLYLFLHTTCSAVVDQPAPGDDERRA